jgi:hypothetical protein
MIDESGDGGGDGGGDETICKRHFLILTVLDECLIVEGDRGDGDERGYEDNERKTGDNGLRKEIDE